jgi:HTH-type transcriptional regulator, sugar sensing transcriptional regulator
MMDHLLSSFSKLGLSAFEAKAYLSLLRKGNITGYELSKESGIPSSKIYSVLNHLAAKNLVVPLESHPVRYLPRAPEEVVDTFSKEFGDTFSFLKKSLGRLYPRQDRDEVVAKNILGEKEIFRKTRELIRETKRTLYLALWKEEWRSIQAAVKKAHAQGVKIYVVTYGSVPIRTGKIYQHLPSDLPYRERGERRFVLVSDDRKALFANFSKEDSEKAVWTENRGLVLLVRDFVIHEIYIVKIREAFPKEIIKTFGSNWEKIRLPAPSTITGSPA